MRAAASVMEFFDPTKAIGRSFDRPTEFLTAADLLVSMNRLGIARAVVYHHEARAYHPGPGNRWLLEELDATPEARARLAPAAVVSPALRYDRHALPELRAAMEAGRVRALRYFKGGEWDLRQMEPIIEELLPFKPVLLLDKIGSPSPAEILDFAHRFPELPIVYLQLMWPGELQLVDLMERCPNLHLDTSWMHSDLTIEFLVKKFGPERLLFGAGPSSHNAACIASLIHSELSEADKALVAGGNLARLLGMGELSETCITPFANPRADKPLWNAYLRGEKLELDVVDAHGHPTVPGMWLREETDPDALLQRTLGEMDRIGIDAMCMAPIRACFGDAIADHADNEQRLSQHPGRFFSYIVFSPRQAPEILPTLDDYFSRDHYIGFKILNDYWGVPITDSVFNPMWAYADKYRLPILMHTWVGVHNDPAMLRDIVPAHPNASFILGHSGGTDHRSAIALAQDNPNVYLEWCGSFCSQQRWEDVIPQVDSKQILYGTDAILHDMDWELGRLLSLDIPDDQLTDILGGNMRRILARRVR